MKLVTRFFQSLVNIALYLYILGAPSEIPMIISHGFVLSLETGGLHEIQIYSWRFSIVNAIDIRPAANYTGATLNPPISNPILTVTVLHIRTDF